jgi:DNA-directed RNA polymerase specialized sigma24 family protein
MEEGDGKTISAEWRKIFRDVNYALMRRRVKTALWAWMGDDAARTVDDAISDAIVILMQTPPQKEHTEDDLVRMIVIRAANKLKNDRRRGRRKAELGDDIIIRETSQREDPRDAPEWKYDWAYMITELNKRVHPLSLQVPCVILAGEWGYEPKEIAEMFCTTDEAVRKTLRRARKNIEDILREDEKLYPPPAQ